MCQQRIKKLNKQDRNYIQIQDRYLSNLLWTGSRTLQTQTDPGTSRSPCKVSQQLRKTRVETNNLYSQQCFYQEHIWLADTTLKDVYSYCLYFTSLYLLSLIFQVFLIASPLSICKCVTEVNRCCWAISNDSIFVRQKKRKRIKDISNRWPWCYTQYQLSHIFHLFHFTFKLTHPSSKTT